MAKFDEGIYYGALSISKQAAKASCASVIIEKLLTTGTLMAGKKTKRLLNENKVDLEQLVIIMHNFVIILARQTTTTK